MRKKYILLKDCPELKKGAILEEKCDNGNQDYRCITIETHRKFPDQREVIYSRDTIMKNPTWFKEIKQIHITEEGIKKLKKLKVEIFEI
jgi:hypothetical protein